MQWWVEMRTWVSVNGGCWRIDCCDSLDDVVVASDSRKNIRYALVPVRYSIGNWMVRSICTYIGCSSLS